MRLGLDGLIYLLFLDIVANADLNIEDALSYNSFTLVIAVLFARLMPSDYC